MTSDDEILDLPLVVEGMITSMWCSDSGNFEKAKAKPPYFSASSSGFLRLSGHQSKVLPVTVIACEPLDLNASMADSATSPAPITRRRVFETFPKMRLASSHKTLPKFTWPLEMPVFVLAHFAAWKPFEKGDLAFYLDYAYMRLRKLFYCPRISVSPTIWESIPELPQINV